MELDLEKIIESATKELEKKEIQYTQFMEIKVEDKKYNVYSTERTLKAYYDLLKRHNSFICNYYSSFNDYLHETMKLAESFEKDEECVLMALSRDADTSNYNKESVKKFAQALLYME